MRKQKKFLQKEEKKEFKHSFYSNFLTGRGKGRRKDGLKRDEAMDAILLDVYLKGVKKGIQTSQKSLDCEDEDDEGPERWRVLRNGVALPIFFKNKELAKDYIYELIERQQDFNFYELVFMDSLFFKN